ncbi:hypothetical protein FACS1894113_5010 [Alphaproteobacteria bacterium]|nr:hypothetical protein FACS1894113_5010 [Alphaproteobacteria bacterium]
MSRIIDIATETFLKKQCRYVCDDYSSKVYLQTQVISDKNIEIEYIAGICDELEKVPKDIQLFIISTSKSDFRSVLIKSNSSFA